MTSLERLFLGMEQNRYPLDGVGILLLDPSTAGPDFGFEHVRRELELQVGRPALVHTAGRRGALQPGSGLLGRGPGLRPRPSRPPCRASRARVDWASSTELAMALTDRALDRSRPLWRLWYVEGVEGGRVALILRIHHALIDGMGGVEMFARLFGSSPEPAPSARQSRTGDIRTRALGASSCSSAPVPSCSSDRSRAFRDLLAVLAASRRGRAAGSGGERGHLFAQSPRVLFNRSVASPDKRLGLISLPLDEIKAVKNAFGVTVHDVVLAIVAGSVRDYLLEYDELPAAPLSVLCPMNMRTGAEDDPTGGNYFASGLGPTADAALRPGDSAPGNSRRHDGEQARGSRRGNASSILRRRSRTSHRRACGPSSARS